VDIPIRRGGGSRSENPRREGGRFRPKWILAVMLSAVSLFTGALEAQPDTVLYVGVEREPGVISPARTQPGDIATVGLFYSDPSDNIQGFTLTLCFDDNLTGIPGTFTIAGTILEVVGAEFISEQVDNDLTDGDGKELVFGILLDAAPPFDGQTAPPTVNPLRIGSFQFQVPATTPCFSCLPILFCDGINGNGQVPLSNRVIIDSNSVIPLALPEGFICVPENALFVRGDANNDGIVDVADVVFNFVYQFLLGPAPVCEDAADFDDDGLINITDPVFLLLYIFSDGISPPSPFPDCGLEPVPDDDGFDCFLPTTSCPVCP
jgi:hypothetical protein